MATQISNTASATYAYGRSSSGSAVSNQVMASLVEEYAINAVKTALNGTFRPGENITYSIQIVNEGTTGNLYTVSVVDDNGGVGTPLSYVENSAYLSINGTLTPINPTSTNPLTFALAGPINAGQSASIIYVARVSDSIDPDVESITNTATVSALEGSTTGQPISVTPNPAATIMREDYANVVMTKNISTTEITEGEPFSYIIELENAGNLPATAVVINDRLPQGFTINSITSESGGTTTTFAPGDYTLDTSTNTLTLPGAGSSQTITVPGATQTGSGLTRITITGQITN